ncbi:transposase [Orientia tsutsugamushi]|uniref:transposase n=1 Tax=Orientia tsutsugamushi TaxID=784 RepID=UPI0009B5A74E
MVILGNISFHKTVVVKSMIESVWCKLLYLPTYSLDLDLIEYYQFKVKDDIHKVSYLFNNFFDAVFYTLQCVIIFSNRAIYNLHLRHHI